MSGTATAGPESRRATVRRTTAMLSPAGRWAIDAGRSTLRVSVKVGLVATVHGTFAEVSGQVDLGSDPIDSRVDVVVGSASLTSGNAYMDGLLQGAGVIDIAKNPSIGFVSHTVRPGSSGGSWLLDGLLATDSAVLDVTLQMADPLQHNGALLFRAKGTLPSKEAVRLLSRSGAERLLGKTMGLDLAVVAVRV